MKLLDGNRIAMKVGSWMTASLVILLLLAPLNSLHAAQSTVYIENKRLETVIRSTLNKPSGDITAEDMALLTSIQTNLPKITVSKGWSMPLI